MKDKRIRPPFEWQHPFEFSEEERKRRRDTYEETKLEEEIKKMAGF